MRNDRCWLIREAKSARRVIIPEINLFAYAREGGGGEKFQGGVHLSLVVWGPLDPPPLQMAPPKCARVIHLPTGVICVAGQTGIKQTRLVVDALGGGRPVRTVISKVDSSVTGKRFRKLDTGKNISRGRSVEITLKQ